MPILLSLLPKKTTPQKRNIKFPIHGANINSIYILSAFLTSACLKNHCTVLTAPLCGMLRHNFGNVAPTPQNRSLPPTKWNTQPGTSIFQTISNKVLLFHLPEIIQSYVQLPSSSLPYKAVQFHSAL